MNLIEQFNAFDGQKVSREDLETFSIKALNAGLIVVPNRVIEVLENDPDVKYFRIAIDEPVTMTQEMDYVDFEIEGMAALYPNADLVKIDDTESPGMGKAVSPEDIYNYITETVINTIQEVGHLPWQKNWNSSSLSAGDVATNFVSKKPYRGINFFMLNYEIVPSEKDPSKYLMVPKIWNIPYFLTFKQIEKLKGKLKKGSSGHRVIYFTMLYSFSQKEMNGFPALDFSTYSQEKMKGWLKKNRSKINNFGQKGSTIEELSNNYIPILKYYNVFNGEDIEGIDFGGYEGNDNADKPLVERMEIGEAIVDSYPNPPEIRYEGDQPAYFKQTDTVLQTPIEAWKDKEEYYSTLFHELVHSTGHNSRLKRGSLYRDNVDSSLQKFLKKKEELTAEMGAVFLSAESGILFNIIDNSAKYLKSWNQGLVTLMKEDNKLFFRAASAAQAAADHILDRDKNGDPAYFKKLSKSEKIKKAKDSENVSVEKSESIDVKKEPSKLSDVELQKVIDVYKSDILWNDDINQYMKKVAVEFKKRKVAKDKLYKEIFETDEKPKSSPKKPIANKSRKASSKTSKTTRPKVVQKSRTAKKTKAKKSSDPKPVSIDDNGQYGMLGQPVVSESVQEPVIQQPIINQVQEISETTSQVPVKAVARAATGTNSKSLRHSGPSNPLFPLVGATSQFLGKLERKPQGSIIVALDAKQGAGKTTTGWKWLNDFASAGNQCLFASLEEHPTSNLFQEKIDKYIDPSNEGRIAVADHFENLKDFQDQVNAADFILIDSWQKLEKMIKDLDYDDQVRNGFDGKVFVIIFQQTTTGRTKGGADKVFDADIVVKGYPGESFDQNYFIAEKNRYTLIDTSTNAYNVAGHYTYDPTLEESDDIIDFTRSEKVYG
ncbi:zincin-like metallopeptidase domain-containing protein [Nonlabens agnitus]|uniref:Antirestriction protein n=1 Tax=Nonlabens agnitus TaxID=870484 RepID=A0A2S9WXA1_9FLAO|nr:zincin-like metallopeptidase domain-containing protein [Nonlabens agnitus]PRP68093.1 hypothetical protein BST86_13855 [Nonlabens agnitus]